MNRFALISIAWFFVLATLGGSLGLSFHKMTCFESGRITLSLDKDFCCKADGERTPENSVAAVCCDFDQVEFKVSVFQPSFEQNFSFVAILPAVSSAIAEIAPAGLRPLLYEEYIPPLPTSKRLAIFCTYLL